MKLLLIFAAVILAATASSTDELWMKFKQDHGKTYKSLKEDKFRFKVFKSTLDRIEEHNAKYENEEETWYMGINQFSDLTDEEFRAQYLSPKPIVTESLGVTYFNLTVPDSIDWREKGAVLSVKDEGSCGSCWAISAVGAIEGQNAIKRNVRLELSSQELVDCSAAYQNNGCNGGWMDNAFAYVRDHGISTLEDYPYTGVNGECKTQSNSGDITLTGFKDIAPGEQQLQQAVGTIGPISAGVDIEKIKDYKGGIFNDFFCGQNLNHGVLVVGYGSNENKHDFWIVQNNWGSGWGEKGYLRMTRNRFNQCGIANKASYPLLS